MSDEVTTNTNGSFLGDDEEDLAMSNGGPNGSSSKVKITRKRYSREMIVTLLELVDEVLPYGNRDWEIIAAKYNHIFNDDRDYVSVRKKFFDLVPRGNTPVQLQNAENIRADLVQKRISARQHTGVIPPVTPPDVLISLYSNSNLPLPSYLKAIASGSGIKTESLTSGGASTSVSNLSTLTTSPSPPDASNGITSSVLGKRKAGNNNTSTTTTTNNNSTSATATNNNNNNNEVSMSTYASSNNLAASAGSGANPLNTSTTTTSTTSTAAITTANSNNTSMNNNNNSNAANNSHSAVGNIVNVVNGGMHNNSLSSIVVSMTSTNNGLVKNEDFQQYLANPSAFQPSPYGAGLSVILYKILHEPVKSSAHAIANGVIPTNTNNNNSNTTSSTAASSSSLERSLASVAERREMNGGVVMTDLGVLEDILLDVYTAHSKLAVYYAQKLHNRRPQEGGNNSQDEEGQGKAMGLSLDDVASSSSSSSRTKNGEDAEKGVGEGGEGGGEGGGEENNNEDVGNVAKDVESLYQSSVKVMEDVEHWLNTHRPDYKKVKLTATAFQQIMRRTKQMKQTTRMNGCENNNSVLGENGSQDLQQWANQRLLLDHVPRGMKATQPVVASGDATTTATIATTTPAATPNPGVAGRMKTSKNKVSGSPDRKLDNKGTPTMMGDEVEESEGEEEEEEDENDDVQEEDGEMDDGAADDFEDLYANKPHPKTAPSTAVAMETD